MIGNRHIGSCGCGGQGQGHKVSYSNKSYSVLEKYVIYYPNCEFLFVFDICLGLCCLIFFFRIGSFRDRFLSPGQGPKGSKTSSSGLSV